MNGQVFPRDYWIEGGLFRTILHSQAAVQLHHRIGAYVLFLLAGGFAIAVVRERFTGPVKPLAILVAVLVTAQAALGVWTLMAVAPVSLGVAHQIGAVFVLAACVALAWRIRRE
jgi:heme a synthase